MTLALGIDVGTGGIRTAVLNEAGMTVAETEAAHDGDRRAPTTWHRALQSALAQLAEVIDVGEIDAVSVDGTSGTVLGLDREGAPVGTALMYNDAVDDPAISAAIAAVAPRESAAHGASSALARAIALQSRVGVTHIVHQADWVASLLAGHPVPSDESNALKTGYDPVQRCWPEWIRQTPLRLTLPEVVPAGAEAAVCSGDFSLPEGAAIVAGVTDGCASFLATGAALPGEGVTALGTTLTIKLLSDRPVFAPEYGIYSHRIGDRWLAGGASNTGGGVLAGFFDADTLASLSGRIDPMRDSGLDYYPLSKPGERFPVNDPDHPPRLSPRPEDDAMFLHGLLEGIGRIEAMGYGRLAELGAPELTSIRTVGGGSRNEVWTRMRGRLLGVSPAPAASTSAAAGVARLALEHLSR